MAELHAVMVLSEEARFEFRQQMTRRIVDRQLGVQDGVQCGEGHPNLFLSGVQ